MNGKGMAVVVSVTHFFAAMAAAFVLSRAAHTYDQLLLLAIIFIVCTYGLQPILGLLADVVNRNTLMASTGCVLIALSFFLPDPKYVAVCCGLGSAVFNVGAGLDVVNTSDKKLSLLSLFLSPDTLGYLCGMYFYDNESLHWMTPAVIVFVLAIIDLLGSSLNRRELRSGNADFSLEPLMNPRSFAGMLADGLAAFILVQLLASQYRLVSDSSAGLLAAFMLFAVGKLMGGILSDRVGTWKLAVTAACLAGVFGTIAVALSSFEFACAALLCTGMLVTPILWSACRLLEGAKGLIMGMINAFIGMSVLLASSQSYAFGAVSLAVIMAIEVVLVILVQRTH